jgi:hypothetical protein
MRGSPSTSISPAIAARSAMTMPAPSSHSDAIDQSALPVRQKARSHTSVATKNAMGNGISIGWIGWPPMLAVERGFDMVTSGAP